LTPPAQTLYHLASTPRGHLSAFYHAHARR
jgi:hypothetical protein